MSIPEKTRTVSDKLTRGEELTESEICYFMDVMGKLVSEEAVERHRDDEYLDQPYEISESDLPRPTLYLYLLSQDEKRGYDTYDSCVVCAKSEDEAKRTHPDEEYYVWNEQAGQWAWRNPVDPDAECRVTNWATRLENIHCKLIGTAAEGTGKGVVIASFNAG